MKNINSNSISAVQAITENSNVTEISNITENSILLKAVILKTYITEFNNLRKLVMKRKFKECRYSVKDYLSNSLETLF